MFLEGLYRFLYIFIEGLLGVIAFIDGLQKLKEFSGRFDGFSRFRKLMEVTPCGPVVLWPGSCGDGLQKGEGGRTGERRSGEEEGGGGGWDLRVEVMWALGSKCRLSL